MGRTQVAGENAGAREQTRRRRAAVDRYQTPRRHLRRALAAALPVPVIGLVLLVASGNLLLPVRQVVTIEAKMASKRTSSRTPKSSGC
ncbi:hypothetical protein SHKM778_31710 [Streptomyces sp. KM77-8]|uniref:Uncharacterized protein n=1 Tax=Streptomyces haneummycinicus TaxID=3074435 RepID=A0AAT9HHE1_9ACTN